MLQMDNWITYISLSSFSQPETPNRSNLPSQLLIASLSTENRQLDEKQTSFHSWTRLLTPGGQMNLTRCWRVFGCDVPGLLVPSLVCANVDGWQVWTFALNLSGAFSPNLSCLCKYVLFDPFACSITNKLKMIEAFAEILPAQVSMRCWNFPNAMRHATCYGPNLSDKGWESTFESTRELHFAIFFEFRSCNHWVYA